jgi:hypothetical protein
MSRHKKPHTHAPRGKRIRVVLKDGTEFVDKFLERRSKQIVFSERSVAIGLIESFTIWRTPPRAMKP